MTQVLTNVSAKKSGRIAGILYLIIIICGLFSEMFVRSGLIVSGDATTTANNIVNAKGLFRLGFASDLVMVMCDVGVALMFYVLLKPVSKGLALLAAFFRLAQATIIGLNLLNYFAVLLLLGDAQYLSAYSAEQLQANAMFFLNMHSYGYLISGVFFGMSCMVLSYLFYKSAHFPKFLGVMLALASVGYLTDCFTNFLAPAYADVSEMLLLPTAVVTELTLCVWLLVKGAKNIKQ